MACLQNLARLLVLNDKVQKHLKTQKLECFALSIFREQSNKNIPVNTEFRECSIDILASTGCYLGEVLL